MEYNHLEYVRKYFEIYYGVYYNRLSKNEVDSLCLTISKSLQNKYNDFKLVKSGIGDKFISSVIKIYVNKEHSKLMANYINMRNYIKNYIENTHFVKYSIDTLYMITEGVCDMLIPTFRYDKMNDGRMDEEISSGYNFVLSGICSEIRKYVGIYISKNIVPLNDIDNVAVENEIIKLMMNSREISSFSILMGRADSKINEIAIKNRDENRNKRLSEMPDTIEYIKRTAEIYTDDMKLVNDIASEVDMKLRDEGITPNEIVSGKHNFKIRKMFNDYYNKRRKLFIYNSIEQDDVPSKIEVVKGKKDINQIISELLVASVLLGAISYGGYTLGKNIRNDRLMDNINKFDSHSYSHIDSVYDTDIKSTAKNIVETFDNYSEFGNDNFSYLGFYRAYNSVGNQKLFVMDNMLSQIKKDIYNKNGYDELRNSINTNGCYLGFIYDRLYEMGYTEINDAKHYELLNSYMKVMNNHKYSNPVEYLSASQQRLLNKVVSKYEELSEQYLLEFGVLLGDKDIVMETSSVRRS